MSSISWGEEFSFASYFRVPQGTRVLTYSQLSFIFFNMLQGISGCRNSRLQTPDRKLSKGITPSNQRRYTNSSIVLYDHYEHQFGDVNPAICGCTQLLLYFQALSMLQMEIVLFFFSLHHVMYGAINVCYIHIYIYIHLYMGNCLRRKKINCRFFFFITRLRIRKI